MCLTYKEESENLSIACAPHFDLEFVLFFYFPFPRILHLASLNSSRVVYFATEVNVSIHSKISFNLFNFCTKYKALESIAKE